MEESVIPTFFPAFAYDYGFVFALLLLVPIAWIGAKINDWRKK